MTRCASCHIGTIGTDWRCNRCGWLDRAAQHEAENPAASAALTQRRQDEAAANRTRMGLDKAPSMDLRQWAAQRGDDDPIEIGPTSAPAPLQDSEPSPVSRRMTGDTVTVSWSNGHETEYMVAILDDPDEAWIIQLPEVSRA